MHVVALTPSQAGWFGAHVPVLQDALAWSQYLPAPHTSTSADDRPSAAHSRTTPTEQNFDAGSHWRSLHAPLTQDSVDAQAGTQAFGAGPAPASPAPASPAPEPP